MREFAISMHIYASVNDVTSAVAVSWLAIGVAVEVYGNDARRISAVI